MDLGVEGLRFNITEQIAGLLERALTEARLDEELKFWKEVIHGLQDFYQHGKRSKLNTTQNYL